MFINVILHISSMQKKYYVEIYFHTCERVMIHTFFMYIHAKYLMLMDHILVLKRQNDVDNNVKYSYVGKICSVNVITVCWHYSLMGV